MKILNILTILLFISLLSCQKQNIDREPDFQVLTPGDENGNSTSTQSTINDELNLKEMPALPIPPDSKAILVRTTNLDNDSEDEQILVLLFPTDEMGVNGRMELWIADYNLAGKEFKLTFKSNLGAQISDSFSLYLINFTLESSPEVVCSGFTLDGKQTLDIFGIANQSPLTYYQIRKENTTGSVEFNHNIDTKIAKIQLSEQNPESVSELDIVIKTWIWSDENSNFIFKDEQKIWGSSLNQIDLAPLFSGNEEDFEDYLSGFWYKRTGNQDDIRIINFEPVSKEITFLVNDEFEPFSWNTSHKNVFNRLYISCTNDFVSTIYRDISIMVDNPETINVAIQNYPIWSGQYERLTDNSLDIFFLEKYSEQLLTTFNIKGEYKGSDGTNLNINLPDFTITSNSSTESGQASFFEYEEELYLQLKYHSRRDRDKEIYHVQYTTSTNSDHIIKTLELVPGTISIRGFSSFGQSSISYEQIEFVEPEIED